MWKAYRNKGQAKAVMAAALRKAYATLFATYPNAHQKDNEALRNFFSSHTDVGESALSLMVRTFKALTELGDFDNAADQDPGTLEAVLSEPEPDAGVTVRQQQRPLAGKGAMTVNINIQLQLPATDNATIYENLFAAMKKNLLS